jgi:putative methyltransferase
LLHCLLCLQEAALLHALHFPSVQRLVYSTCSVHQRENEDVVAAVLPAATAAGFRLIDPFPTWHRRGLPVVEGSELLVRTDGHADGTDGFFVALFERSGKQQQKQGQRRSKKKAK